MSILFIFMSGFIIGGLCGTLLMALIQVNHEKEN